MFRFFKIKKWFLWSWLGSFLIFLYVFFNIGMVTGLIPVVGAPLPFISNGGTSLITIFIGLGIIQSIRVSRNV